MASGDSFRTIPQRLRTTFAPVATDAQFDDVIARLGRACEADAAFGPVVDTLPAARHATRPLTTAANDTRCQSETPRDRGTAAE